MNQQDMKKTGQFRSGTLTELESYFIFRCWKGLTKLGHHEKLEYQKRLQWEIEQILKTGFCGYLLTVADVLDWSRKNNILCGPGRGCFIPDTPIFLDNQSKKSINEIQIKDTVISHDGSINLVELIQEYEIDEEVLELNFANGSSFTCTVDHLILTKNRSWVQARNLTEEDEIVIVAK